MNTGRLLAYFETISDAADAVAQLRGFILNLAVRGKIVEQDPNDEPASTLRVRIAQEKETRRAACGGIAAAKVMPPLLEKPYGIPDSWSWSQLSEIGVISPRNDAPDTLMTSFVPMTLIAAEYGVAHRHQARPWGEIKNGYTHFAQGDVGLAKITPCFENGKSTVFTNLTGGIGSGTTELHIVRPIFVESDYVLLFLKSPYFIETGVPLMTGTAGQKRVSTEYFSHSPFPLPPLAEQRRIVVRVHELMILCDKLEAVRMSREVTRDRLTASTMDQLKRPNPDTLHEDTRFVLNVLPTLTARSDQIKALRQAFLHLAVRGKLVAQKPTDQPASELLKRIKTENEQDEKRRNSRRQDRLPEIDPKQAPFPLPKGWAWARFPELGLFGRGKSKHRPRNDPTLFVDGTHPVIQTGDVARSKGVIETHTSKYNDIGLSQSHKWPKGTLCITIAANIADSGILTFDACFPDSVVGFVPASPFETARYFEYFVRTAKANLLEFAPATAQKNINLEILTAVLIPLPSLAEQQRIVNRVDELMTLCDQLEALLICGEQSRARLLNALIHEAIEGADYDVPATRLPEKMLLA